MGSGTSNDEAWLSAEPPKEIYANNPFKPDSTFHRQWRHGMATRWRIQKRCSGVAPSGGFSDGSASNAAANPASSDEK